MTQPYELSAVDARQALLNQSLSPLELLDSCLSRIDTVNSKVNAVVALDADAARDRAKRDEARLMAGESLGLLGGLPVGVKDLNATRNLRTTWGSLLFENHVPTSDDAMVANVRNRGGNIFAKTNTPEFGAGANTTNRVYGATGNPFDPIKTCAGSSGGSAVALALSMMPLATGSDYGGSLRTPAAFCGVTGFRPSPGLVPACDRPVALNPFAVVGPMGRTVADTHLLLRAQLDGDKRDPFANGDHASIPETLIGADLSQLKVAWSTDLGCAEVDKDIRQVFESRIKLFGTNFSECDERNPDFEGVHDVFEVIRGFNFVAAHHDRVKQQRDLLDRNVIDNTERGLQYSLADVSAAHVQQTVLYNKFISFFDDVDVLICPAAQVSPFPHSQLFVENINDVAMPTYMRWLTLSYALTMALPSSCVIPCGLDHNKMPFGIQVVGPNGSDAKVLSVALSLEQMLARNALTARPVSDL